MGQAVKTMRERVKAIGVIHSNRDYVSGTPVFKGTRVPVDTLVDFLTAGDNLDDFLEDFPTVSREQAIEALNLSKYALEASLMKLFIDESLNVRLRHRFPEHDTRTVEIMGWKSVGNGELLALARHEFDAFITRDQNGIKKYQTSRTSHRKQFQSLCFMLAQIA